MTGDAGDEHAIGSGIGKRLINIISLGMLALLMFVLIKNFTGWISDAIFAVEYPYQIDYGEGVIWQQALMILRGEGYSDIAQLPYVVFHYPPVYHLLTALFAEALSLNFLAAGRVVSVVSTLGASAIVGGLVFTAVRSREALLPSLTCAFAGSLTAFLFNPVATWSTLMRVDTTAIFLSFVGAYFGLRAPERPRLLYLSALFFLLALYTKQTSISAPVATLFVLWLIQPRLAARGLIMALGTGLIGLIAIQLLTDGGFFKHIVLYNINNFSIGRFISAIKIVFFYNAVYIIFVLFFLINLYFLIINGKTNYINNLKINSKSSIYFRINLFVAIYIILTSLTLVTIGKVGSNFNYFLESMFGWSFAIGLILRQPTVTAFNLIAASIEQKPPRERNGLVGPYLRFDFPILFAAMLFQALVIPVPGVRGLVNGLPGSEQQAQLLTRVRNATKPVISENMVAVLQAGKEVVWESAIFNQLVAFGRWDERPFIRMIESKKFAFIILNGRNGDPNFSARYSNSLLRAIEHAYPRIQELAGYDIHLPAN